MKENILEFYVNKFECLNNIDNLDLSFLNPIVRRRMSKIDRLTLAMLKKTYTDNIQFILFSSQYGQVDRLIKIINQYTKCKEVSPNTFSGSVLNHSVGFFLINEQKSIPYTSLSACENSVSIGLLSSVISNYDNVLFCYADANNNETNSLAINLTKNYSPKAQKYCIKIEHNSNVEDKFENYSRLFDGVINSLKTPEYTIERIR